MGKGLATLVIGGALLLGCAEKPKPPAKLWIDPITMARIQEIGKPREIVERSKKEVQSPPKQKEAEIFDTVTYQRKKYETGYGNFEVDGLKYKGVIWKGDNKRYGIVKTELDITKINGEAIMYKIVPPKKNFPSTFFNDSRWIEALPTKMTKKTFGKETYYVLVSRRKVCGSNGKNLLEKLPLLLIPKKTLIRLDENGRENAKGKKGMADFYVPIKIKQLPDQLEN